MKKKDFEGKTFIIHEVSWSEVLLQEEVGGIGGAYFKICAESEGPDVVIQVYHLKPEVVK